MGYPMTYRRLIARNSLDTGDYQKMPERGNWHSPDKVAHNAGQWTIEALFNVLEVWAEAGKRSNDQVMIFLGDLRRLEHDTLDERAVCLEIARRLDFDPDVVAAVLKAFMEV